MAPFAEALEVGPDQTSEQGGASINGLFADTGEGRRSSRSLV